MPHLVSRMHRARLARFFHRDVVRFDDNRRSGYAGAFLSFASLLAQTAESHPESPAAILALARRTRVYAPATANPQPARVRGCPTNRWCVGEGHRGSGRIPQAGGWCRSWLCRFEWSFEYTLATTYSIYTNSSQH